MDSGRLGQIAHRVESLQREATEEPAGSACRGQRDTEYSLVLLISSKLSLARDGGVALLDPAAGPGCGGLLIQLIQRRNLGICLACMDG
jgi:hypothetical protein